MQPNGYIKVAAMPGGSLPTTRRHLPTQQKGGILYPIIKIPYNNSKNTSTTNPITISNTNTTTNTTVINYNPIIPSTAPNRRKLPTTAANNNNGISNPNAHTFQIHTIENTISKHRRFSLGW